MIRDRIGDAVLTLGKEDAAGGVLPVEGRIGGKDLLARRAAAFGPFISAQTSDFAAVISPSFRSGV